MNKKVLVHAIMIAAVVVATFVAAALTPANTFAKTSESSAVINIAKVDFESRTLHADRKMIVDNEMPLAQAPSVSDMGLNLEWMIVAAAAVVTGIIVYIDRKDTKATQNR